MTSEELEREIKRLEEQIEDKINSLRIKFLESEANKKLYEVKVPEDIENYYYIDETGLINELIAYDEDKQKEVFKRGLAFKTREEAEKFDKERILINKLKDWTKKYNDGWTPNWDETFEAKYCVEYNNYLGEFITDYYSGIFTFSKLPYFKSKEIAEQFLEEFEDEIKEVFY